MTYPTGDLRQGRHNKRLVYKQIDTDGPRDDDRLVAVFFEEDEAADVVMVMNGVMAELRGPA